MSQDPEDEQTQEREPQLGRVHYFRGTPLPGFSWNVRMVLHRVLPDYASPHEEYAYLVYLLLKKSPVEMDAIRSPEEITAFRLEASAWAENEKVGHGKGWEELMAVGNNIINESNESASLEPVPSKGGKKKLGK